MRKMCGGRESYVRGKERYLDLSPNSDRGDAGTYTNFYIRSRRKKLIDAKREKVI